MSLIKIYLKFLKNTPTCFGHSTIELYLESACHRQALSKYNSKHITRHAATSPVFNIGVSKVLLIKSDFSEELKKLPDDGRMTETCRSVFKKF